MVVGSINKFFFIVFTIFFVIWSWAWSTNFNPTKCDDGHQFGSPKCVVSNMWTMTHLVPTCNVNGYGEFGNCSTLKYILVCHCLGWWLWHWINRFNPRDYVYLQKITPVTLDVIVKLVILHVWKVLPFVMLLLEVHDAQTWKDRVHNSMSCHLPNVGGQMDPSLVVVHARFHYMLGGQFIGIVTMFICD